jgi:hypothetical protein
MTRDEALNQALLNLQAAERKVATMTTLGTAVDAANARVRIARGYVDLAIEISRNQNSGYRQA